MLLKTASDFGIPRSKWEAAKRQARKVMIATAKRQRTIAYSELVKKIYDIEFEAHDKRLFDFLGEIASEENAAGRGMLTVVVVHKSGDLQPGPGFFELAEQLGYDASDKLAFWSAELAKVYAYWRTRSA
jgi:hypothetical protein